MTMLGSPSRCWESTGPKYFLPLPKTTGTTSIATSSTRPSASACPPTLPAHTATTRSPARSLASCTAAATSPKNGTSASGCQPVGFGRWDTTTRRSPERGETLLDRLPADRHVAVEVPLEERADIIVRGGDEAVHGYHCVRDHGCHTGTDLAAAANSSPDPGADAPAGPDAGRSVVRQRVNRTG